MKLFLGFQKRCVLVHSQLNRPKSTETKTWQFPVNGIAIKCEISSDVDVLANI